MGTEDGLLNCSYSAQHIFHHNADADDVMVTSLMAQSTQKGRHFNTLTLVPLQLLVGYMHVGAKATHYSS